MSSTVVSAKPLLPKRARAERKRRSRISALRRWRRPEEAANPFIGLNTGEEVFFLIYDCLSSPPTTLSTSASPAGYQDPKNRTPRNAPGCSETRVGVEIILSAKRHLICSSAISGSGKRPSFARRTEPRQNP